MLFVSLGVIAALAAVAAAYLQRPVFGANPTGERLARIQQSPNYRDGAFQNLSHTPAITGDKSIVRASWDALFDLDKNVKPSAPVPSVKTNLHRLPADRNWYVWLGHSSYLMQLDGKRFLVDPVLAAASPLPFGGKPFAGADIYQPTDIPAVDYLIISHDHYDHLDYATLRQIQPKINHVVSGLGVGAHLERWGFSAGQITELDWHEAVQLTPDIRLTALPARHFSGRALKRNQTLWASFMLQTPSETVYIGGDSGYDAFFKQIGVAFPDISLAILENGQYDQDWANIHFLPEHLVQAVKDLQPKRLLAVHNSKFVLAKHAWDEPMRLLADNVARENLPLLTPKIGEVLYLDEQNQQFERWWQAVPPKR
ncbi:MBL fold metallo-hydrolase [Testudinibacter sp. TR-2022]|uniref:MBL fold metallo-hydrolase n=1 Tax=Testudinibacter sp. TR-2022 TaxID=2585029 RepID=UPI001118AEB5|nr:MBL fold metallo-hydrolase [Testudinibacter sp. TR-2022]TNH02462.1 MBL fold metallo-hydrolase [Pasteurellaceae bacterium Phil31]TNH09882.1 MBL fold metallo-hydrolase [Testudinibacter sp. TR-2022]TNH10564.1 MBL fold metallo-hydrolase [Testudinibacter sp. TR-2022]TNH13635.1 MBL fold metallo-hydrolase [Testudinibacter sp. TR-2022]TNH18157.1 MBL fold metallo-hydrolase [Testudinibacter sp. TR-2022]